MTWFIGRSARPLSLHARVLLWFLLSILVVWPALWMETRDRARDAARGEIDQRLRTAAAVLIQISPGRSVAPVEQLTAGGEGASSRLTSFEILDNTKRVVARTAYFPGGARNASLGFESRRIDAVEWRIYTVFDQRRGLTCRVAHPMSDVDVATAGFEARFADPLLAAAPLALILGFGALWIGLKPLRDIEHAMARQDAENPQPLPLNAAQYPTELRTLVETLNDLLRRLKRAMGRRETYASIAGHELRTPLAGLLSQIEVARATNEPNKREKALATIEDTTLRLSHLVNQLLTLARSERAELAENHISVDLGRVVDEAIALHPARERLNRLGNVGLLMARGDSALLHAALTNLIDNALSASPEEGSVHVYAAAEGHEAVIAVRDFGPGIPTGESLRLLEPFARGSDDSKGAGLGLAIVQAVVDAHRGSVRIENPKGRGARVRLSLPLQTAGELKRRRSLDEHS